MKSYLLETPIGFILFDQNEKVILNKLLYENLADYTDILLSIVEENIPESLLELRNDIIKQNIKEIIVENSDLKEFLSNNGEINVQVENLNPKFKELRNNLSKTISSIDPKIDEVELQNCAKYTAEFLTKKKVSDRDDIFDINVKHLIESFEDTIKFINSYATRLREWYGVNFPEFTDNLVSDAKLYSKIVLKFGDKKNITTKELITELGVNESFAEQIEKIKKRSMGSDLEEYIIESIQKLCKQILDLFDFKEEIEKDLRKVLKKGAPNLERLLGTQLAGKIIAQANGLKRLAMLPSSTIQVLGAEKALFRSLKERNFDSPKHGIIYTWPKIRGSSYWLRGKISRLLAGKISICSKVDYFKGKFMADEVISEIELKINDLKEKFPKPPKKEPKKSGKEKTKGNKPEFRDHGERSSSNRKDIDRRKRQNISKSKYKKSAKQTRRR